MRFGGTAFWKGGLAAKAYQNWNMFGHYVESPNNKKVIAYINDGGTAVISVFYREV